MFFLDWWYSKKEYGSGQNKAFTFTFHEEKNPKMKQKQCKKQSHTLLLFLHGKKLDLTSENKDFFCFLKSFHDEKKWFEQHQC